jgi:aryl-phospho-beta-D-glucosidase BglC (GH1 family)
MLLRLLLFTLILTHAHNAVAQASPNWRRFQHIQRGINVSEWFAQSNDYSAQRLKAYTTLEDIDLIKRLGFDHVRISIDPAIFECRTTWEQCDRVQALDEVVSRALDRDLALIIDLHPSGEYKKEIATSDSAVDHCVLLWGRIAAHYAKRDPDKVLFELMNEPELSDGYRWAGIQQRLMTEVRRNAPAHTIILSGAKYSDIENLIQVPESTDANVIYNFHYYEPHIFTHQGASWGSPYWMRLKSLPFPASESQIEQAKNRELDDVTRWKLTQYALDRWDENRVATEIGFAADWAKRRNVPLTCNEFGSYRNFTDSGDRMRWIAAVRKALEQNKVGWTMWDYRGGFGVVTKQNGQSIPDDGVLTALGLARARSQ